VHHPKNPLLGFHGWDEIHGWDETVPQGSVSLVSTISFSPLLHFGFLFFFFLLLALRGDLFSSCHI
jgi:hypothetical protein